MLLYPTSEYRATKEWPYSIAAGCVIYRLNKDLVEVLLLLRKAGEFPELIDGHIDSYHLPKGHMKIGDTLESTALREAKEEAGCIVELKGYLGARQNNYVDVGIVRDKAIHYFAAQWKEDDGKMDNEHTSRVWLRLDEALEKLGDSNPKREDEIVRRLKKFLELTGAS